MRCGFLPTACSSWPAPRTTSRGPRGSGCACTGRTASGSRCPTEVRRRSSTSPTSAASPRSFRRPSPYSRSRPPGHAPRVQAQNRTCGAAAPGKRVFAEIPKACLPAQGRGTGGMLPVLSSPRRRFPVPKSLLLADDSVTIQKAVEMTFKAEDVTLTVVSDGNEALSRARAAKPDLILADVGMPGLGGYELCEKVRADAGIRHIPVLLLGGGTPIDPAKAIAVGANGHMPKPFDSQKLVDQVK